MVKWYHYVPLSLLLIFLGFQTDFLGIRTWWEDPKCEECGKDLQARERSPCFGCFMKKTKEDGLKRAKLRIKVEEAGKALQETLKKKEREKN